MVTPCVSSSACKGEQKLPPRHLSYRPQKSALSAISIGASSCQFPVFRSTVCQLSKWTFRSFYCDTEFKNVRSWLSDSWHGKYYMHVHYTLARRRTWTRARHALQLYLQNKIFRKLFVFLLQQIFTNNIQTLGKKHYQIPYCGGYIKALESS